MACPVKDATGHPWEERGCLQVVTCIVDDPLWAATLKADSNSEITETVQEWATIGTTHSTRWVQISTETRPLEEVRIRSLILCTAIIVVAIKAA